MLVFLPDCATLISITDRKTHVPSEDYIAFYTESWSITIRLACVVVGLVHALFCCFWNAVMDDNEMP